MNKEQIEKLLLELAKEIGMKNIILMSLDLAISEDKTLRSDEVEKLIKIHRQIEKL
ncbi:hypothetical protein [Staphylococcus aureus]|uniref:hypothetical protein n=1 Tax=Staphylococcus aureus TaxID=1280 RepID=UPI00045275E2|nr:hypothetical protein [Staphylococcus aureus]EJN0116428.1 hypothetical protein [Staphylococcus aureus]EZT30404.1 hypothetical protein V113_02717 [Staphylococcus aureus Tur-4]EZT49529.1 hypothetical protein V056_02304 [Staphylococcus aureus MSSA-123]EZT73208.1 hypothetical protein V103_02768 [Staphylococcus aureus 22(2K81-5)]EZT77641.1 hypothetical protein V082_02790 [Staphylococcus aureus 2011-60-2275-7]